MAETKKYLHTLDVSGNKITNLLLNPLTTAQRTTIGGTLGLTDQGYVTFDVSTNELYFWDGVTWILSSGLTTWGSITGTITAQTDLIAYLSTNYYPVTNPAGYITSAALSPYLTSATAASTYVPLSRNITINGTTYDLSADRSWTVSGLPSQATHAGQWLQTDGTNASWQTLSGNVSLFTNDAGYLTSSAISGMVTGTGVATRVAFWDTTSSISSDADLYWDNVNKRLGIGTATPNHTLSVIGNGLFQSIDLLQGGTPFITFTSTDPLSNNTWTIGNQYDYGYLNIQDSVNSTNIPIRIAKTSGNVIIGAANSSTITSYKLDVNGNQNISGYLNFKPSAAPTSIRIGSNDIENGGASPNNDRLVLIGNNVAIALTAKTINQADSLIAIGYGAAYTSTSGGLYSVHIGRNSGGGITTGEFNTHIGSGDNINIPFGTSYSIHLTAGGGYEFNNAARLLSGLNSKYAFIGGGYNSAGYINDFYLGAGPFVTEPQLSNLNIYAPSSTTDNTVGGSWNGTNAPGSNFTINAGRGTGTGTPGDFIVKTAAKTTTGNTLQTLTQRVKVAGDNGEVTINNLATGGVDQMVTVDTSGVLKKQTIPSGSTSPLTTKGDLYTYSTLDARLPVGLDTQVLLADSSTPTGLKWGTNTAATPTGYYAQYFSYLSQTATTNFVGIAMYFETPDLSNGITIVSNGGSPPNSLTKITFANTGIYNLTFSTQFQNLSNAPQDVFIWLRKNGITSAADVIGSTGVVGLEARKNPGDPYHTIITWNFVLDVVAGDFYQIVWATSDITNVTIEHYIAQPGYPSTVSTLFTVTQQSGIMAGTGVTNVSASMVTPAQTVSVTNPTTTPAISIDDTNLLFDKFMVNQFCYFLPKDASALYDTLRLGGTLLSTGTVSSLSENPMGIQYQTAAATGSVSGQYGTSFGGNILGVNFQFDMYRRFRITTNNGAQRFFAGISGAYSTSAPTNVEPTSITNVIGVAKLQATANLYFVWNDASGVASSLDLGSGFLGTDTAATYTLRIWKTIGVAAVNLQLTKIVTSTGVTTTTNTTILSDYNTGTTHFPFMWVGNNTGGAGACSMKDYGCMMLKRNIINA